MVDKTNSPALEAPQLMRKWIDFGKKVDAWILGLPLPVLFGLSFFWTFYCLFMVLNSGYMSDDAYNSMIRGFVHFNDISIFKYTWDQIIGWAQGAGRLFPLGFYPYPLFYYLESRVVFKILCISVIALDVAVFAYIVYKVTRSKRMAILTFLAVPTFFQFRAWHDPILGFAFLIPITTLEIFLSFAFFEKYLSSQKKKYSLISILVFACANLTYEISYPFLVFFPILAYLHTGKIRQSLKLAQTHLIVGSCMLGFMMWMRSSFNPYFKHQYPGAEVHLSVWPLLEALGIQLYAAFPLSYHFRSKISARSFLKPGDLLIILSYFWAIFYLFRSLSKEVQGRTLILFGFPVLFVPAFVIAASGHQEEINSMGWGFGYLPVFTEYFGMFLVIAGCYFELQRRIHKKWVNALFTGLVCFFLAKSTWHNLSQNRYIVNDSNTFYLYPRETLTAALKDGILSDVPHTAPVLVHFRFPSDHYPVVSQYSGRVFKNTSAPEDYLKGLLKKRHFPNEKEIPKKIFNEDLSKEGVYIMTYRYDPLHGKTGTVFLAQLDHFSFDGKANQILELAAKSLRVYHYKTRTFETISLNGKFFNFYPLIQTAGEAPLKSSKDLKVSFYSEASAK